MLYKPFNLIIEHFWSFFFWRERVLSLTLYIRVKIIPWETLHICKTMNWAVNFSINKTYKPLFLLTFRPLLFFWKICKWWGKWLSYSNSAGEKLTEYWKFNLEIFFQASIIDVDTTSNFRLHWKHNLCENRWETTKLTGKILRQITKSCVENFNWAFPIFWHVLNTQSTKK